MSPSFSNPAPLMFNPLKHYLPYIRQYIESNVAGDLTLQSEDIKKELRHLGTCVMDIYSGDLSLNTIFSEILGYLETHDLFEKGKFKVWAGTKADDYKTITLSDSSRWMIKFHDNEIRYVHIFPARSSPHTFRTKANTLKSAVLYIIVIGKDFVTEDDLNTARAYAGLSPVREVADAEAVTEMIEILRK